MFLTSQFGYLPSPCPACECRRTHKGEATQTQELVSTLILSYTTALPSDQTILLGSGWEPEGNSLCFREASMSH